MPSRFIDHLLTGNHASRPAAGDVPEGTLYSCTDHLIVYQSDTSTWSNYLNVGTSGIPGTIFDAKGDILVASAADTAARLAVGADNALLVADSAQSTGLAWRSAWTGYTPSLTAASSNPTLGSGSSAAGTYIQLGKLVVARGVIAFGASGVAAGSGEYYVSLPVNAASSQMLGNARLFDNSAGFAYWVGAERQSASTFKLFRDGAGSVTHAAPFAWAASDQISWVLTYEAA